MTEQELVQKCLFEIFKKNGYENTDTLTQRHYDHISRQIEAQTSVLISVSTLKRLMHGAFSRLPQIATLNAISSYLGFAGWQEYKSSIREAAPFPNTTALEGRKDQRLRLPAVALLLVALLVIFLFIAFAARPEDPHFELASFSAQKTTANDLPNTVVFSYNVDGIAADSFFIQQSWDVSRRVRVYPGQHTLTDIYYEPGYHIAKLIANDSVIRTVDVSIPTDHWFVYSRALLPGSLPRYITWDKLPVQEGVFALQPAELAAAEINGGMEQNFYYLYFPTSTPVHSDNYCLKTRVRLKELRNNLCPKLMVEIFGQRNYMFFKSTSPGCASEALIQYGEHVINGKQADLSALTYELTDWMEIEVQVKDKNVTVLLQNQPVYRISYELSCGQITGFGFIANGLCEIDYLQLYSLDGREVYANDFEEDTQASLQDVE